MSSANLSKNPPDSGGNLHATMSNPLTIGCGGITLHENPSSFTIFNSIRQSLLNATFKASIIAGSTNDTSLDSTGCVSVSESDVDNLVEQLRIPKVVAVGLTVVFELIRESRNTDPSLCSRALHALLDTLQGQPLEGLASEPSDVINSLFDLLMELNCATRHSTTCNLSSTTNDGNCATVNNVSASANESMNAMMKSSACSCLLSLVAARGDSGKILSAISGILTTANTSGTSQSNQGDVTMSNISDEIEVPHILLDAQKAVKMVLLDHKYKNHQSTTPAPETPTWMSHGFPSNSLFESFKLRDLIKSKKSKSMSNIDSSITFDGEYLYILLANVIYKVGSGYARTIRGQVVATRKVSSAGSTVHSVSSSNSNGNSQHLARHSHHLQSKYNSSQQRSYSLDGHSSTSSGPSGARAWIGWIKGYLYLQPDSWQSHELLKLDTVTLKEVAHVSLAVVPTGPVVACTDGEYLITISSTKNESFVMRSYKPSTLSPQQSLSSTFMSQTPNYLMTLSNELNLTLAHQCLVLVGVCPALTENERTSKVQCASTSSSSSCTNNQHNESLDDNDINSCLKYVNFLDDPCDIISGKDFAILLTSSGKVYFSGRSQSLGVKHLPSVSSPASSSNTSSLVKSKPIGDWYELALSSKCAPKVIQVAVGHEGCHVLLVTSEGTVYFAGLTEKGEDGDLNKTCRRMPKTMKPKKMSRISAKFAACNHGTSAIVTRKGELFMFGKDINHCDKSTGQVICLNDGNFCDLTQVALGKAHTLALTSKGYVYSFGFNNKGQCGREIVKPAENKVDLSSPAKKIVKLNDSSSPIVDKDASADVPIDLDTSDDRLREVMALCASGNHRWKSDGCMICTMCNACTGYGLSCISRSKPDHVPQPGEYCGCGIGHSGCADCGMCQRCDNLMKDVYRRNDQETFKELIQLKHRLKRSDNTPHGSPSSHSIDPLKLNDASKNIRVLFADQTADEILTQATGQAVHPVNLDETGGVSDSEGNKLASLPPTRIAIDGKAVQIACGLHHSLVLTESGDVYAFGLNQVGQLGLGDFTSRDKPVKVPLPRDIAAIAAGSNHSVFLSHSGQVYTCGSNNKGQLGLSPPKSSTNLGELTCVNKPTLVAKIGPQYGRRATSIHARGDCTFIKMYGSLINPLELSHVKSMANGQLVVLSPPASHSQECMSADENEKSFYSLIINRTNGLCRTFNEPDQLNLSQFDASCLDSSYNVMWSFNSTENSVSCYSLLTSQSKFLSNLANSTPFFQLPSIISPEIALPSRPDCKVSKTNAALNLLSCIHTLAKSTEVMDSSFNNTEEPANNSKCKDDYLVVNRFESNGGGWAYSGHSIEAIRFSVDTDIQIVGLSLFGGRGEYGAKSRLYDLGPDGGDIEGDGELLTETDEIPYGCSPKAKFPLLYDEPITISANRWYVAWARVHGPSSDCGSAGSSVVTTDDGVTFTFKPSKKSNNGTDVNAGQIPQILYKLLPPVTSNVPCNFAFSKSIPDDDIYLGITDDVSVKLSPSFAMSISGDTFTSLLKLLNWSWTSFTNTIAKMSSVPVTSIPSLMADAKQFTYVSCVALHLLRIYTNLTFPAPSKLTNDTQVSQSSLNPAKQCNSSTVSASSNTHLNTPGDKVTCPSIGKVSPESLPKIAEAIADVRTLIKCILTDDLFNHVTVSLDGSSFSTSAFMSNIEFSSTVLLDDLIDWKNELECMSKQILFDAKSVFASCYHAFYPCSSLRWNSLTDILINHKIDAFESSRHNLHLLAVIFASLCDCNIPYIRYTFPLDQTIDSPAAVSPVEDLSSPNESTPSVSCNQPSKLNNSPPCNDIGVKCEALINCLIERSNQHPTDNDHLNKYNLRDVLNKLLAIVIQPIEAAIKHTSSKSYASSTEFSCILECNQLSKELTEYTCNLITCIVYELTAQSLSCSFTAVTPATALLQTPSRFARVSPNVSWTTSSDSVEALCFQVDRNGIVIVGATVFTGSTGKWHYILELMECHGGGVNDERLPPLERACGYSDSLWKIIATAKGTFGPPESKSDEITTEIHFEKPVSIKANVKYTIKLSNQGSPTYSGDAATSTVIGPDGAIFTFSDSFFSSNGTNHLRGQLPSLLYYSSAPVVSKTTSTNDAPEKSKKIKETKESGKDGKHHRPSSDAGKSQVTIKLYDPIQARKNLSAIFDLVIEMTRVLLVQIENLTDDTLIDFVASSSLVTVLLPCVLASQHSIIQSHTKSCIFVASAIKKLLPLVASLNKFLDRSGNRSRSRSRSKSLCQQQQQLPSPQGLPVGSLITTSKYHSVLESDHPYKAGSISTYNLTFPDCVKWMTIEFDSRCGTAKPEDTLQILAPCRVRSELKNSLAAIPSVALASSKFIKSTDQSSRDKPEYLPVIKKLSGPPASRSSICTWPTKAIVIPGNELIFSLETASDYAHQEDKCYFGFRVQVIGYESPVYQNGLANLEQELALLASLCMASLLSPSLQLTCSAAFPPELMDASSLNLTKKVSNGRETPKVDESKILTSFKAHSTLLSKGLNFSHMPTVIESLDDQLPFNSVKGFLVDFINATPGTSGGRLAHWLLPESYVDPANCIAQVKPLSGDTLQVAWPIQVIVKIRDQYSRPVTCPDLKVEVTQPYHLHSNASASTCSNFSSHNVSNQPIESKKKPPTNENLTFESIEKVSFDIPYQVTCGDKMRYHAITFMPAYEDYSFEELRFMTPVKKRSVELLMMTDNKDGTYVAFWTPNLPGLYNVSVKIDGQQLSSVQSIMVTGPPAGTSRGQKFPSTSSADDKTCLALNIENSSKNDAVKMRQCVAEKSNGLRVRVLPSLQSEQIGLVSFGDVISFIDEVHNVDGIWLRLSGESILKYCYDTSNLQRMITEAWIMQYNSHYGKSYLLPVVDENDPQYANNQVTNDASNVSSLFHQSLNDTNGEMTLFDDTSAHISLQDEQPAKHQNHHHHRHHRHQHKQQQQQEQTIDPPVNVDRCFQSINQVSANSRRYRARRTPLPQTYIIDDWSNCPVEYLVMQFNQPLYFDPCKSSPVITTLTSGDRIRVSCRSANVEGVWLKLDSTSTAKYCDLLFDVANFADPINPEFWILSSTVDGSEEYLQAIDSQENEFITDISTQSPCPSPCSVIAAAEASKSSLKRKSSSSSSSTCSLNDSATYIVSSKNLDSIDTSTTTASLCRDLKSPNDVTGEMNDDVQVNTSKKLPVNNSVTSSSSRQNDTTLVLSSEREISTDSGAASAISSEITTQTGKIDEATQATTVSTMTLSDISSICASKSKIASQSFERILGTNKFEISSEISLDNDASRSAISLPNAKLSSSPVNSKVGTYRKLLSESLRGSISSATAKMADFPLPLKISVRERVQSLSSRNSSPCTTPPMTPPSIRRQTSTSEKRSNSLTGPTLLLHENVTRDENVTTGGMSDNEPIDLTHSPRNAKKLLTPSLTIDQTTLPTDTHRQSFTNTSVYSSASRWSEKENGSNAIADKSSVQHVSDETGEILPASSFASSSSLGHSKTIEMSNVKRLHDKLDSTVTVSRESGKSLTDFSSAKNIECIDAKATAAPSTSSSSSSSTCGQSSGTSIKCSSQSPTASANGRYIAPGDRLTDSATVNSNVPYAMTCSSVECVRSVFASFIWHEGILHDAIAMSSCLKFNQALTKQLVKKSHKYNKLASSLKMFHARGDLSHPYQLIPHGNKCTEYTSSGAHSRPSATATAASSTSNTTDLSSTSSNTHADQVKLLTQQSSLMSHSPDTQVNAHATSKIISSMTSTSPACYSKKQKAKYRHSLDVLHSMQLNESYVNANVDLSKPIDEVSSHSDASQDADTVNDNTTTHIESHDDDIKMNSSHLISCNKSVILEPIESTTSVVDEKQWTNKLSRVTSLDQPKCVSMNIDESDARKNAEYDEQDDEDNDVPNTVVLILLMFEHILRACMVIGSKYPSVVLAGRKLSTLTNQPTTPVEMFNQMASHEITHDSNQSLLDQQQISVVSSHQQQRQQSSKKQVDSPLLSAAAAAAVRLYEQPNAARMIDVIGPYIQFANPYVPYDQVQNYEFRNLAPAAMQQLFARAADPLPPRAAAPGVGPAPRRIVPPAYPDNFHKAYANQIRPQYNQILAQYRNLDRLDQMQGNAHLAALQLMPAARQGQLGRPVNVQAEQQMALQACYNARRQHLRQDDQAQQQKFIQICQLCGNEYNDPFKRSITYHMKRSHAGCGGSNGGKGFNSAGHYCNLREGQCGLLDWSGSKPYNTGTCYLMCEKCRTKNINRSISSGKKSKKSHKSDSSDKSVTINSSSRMLDENRVNCYSTGTGSSITSYSPHSSLEAYLVMKQNALFLLSLASASSDSSASHRSSSCSISNSKHAADSSGDNNLTAPINTSRSSSSQFDSWIVNSCAFECLDSFECQNTIYRQRMAEDILTEDEIRAIQDDRPTNSTNTITSTVLDSTSGTGNKLEAAAAASNISCLDKTTDESNVNSDADTGNNTSQNTSESIQEHQLQTGDKRESEKVTSQQLFKDSTVHFAGSSQVNSNSKCLQGKSSIFTTQANLTGTSTMTPVTSIHQSNVSTDCTNQSTPINAPSSLDVTCDTINLPLNTRHSSTLMDTNVITSTNVNSLVSSSSSCTNTVQRRRATSNDNTMSSVLCQPSPTLAKLAREYFAIPCDFTTDKYKDQLKIDLQHDPLDDVINRPVLQFVVKCHDLTSLSICMKNASRKAACRSFALHGLTWLLRNVTQPIALHDIMWSFVSALSPVHRESSASCSTCSTSPGGESNSSSPSTSSNEIASAGENHNGPDRIIIDRSNGPAAAASAAAAATGSASSSKKLSKIKQMPPKGHTLDTSADDCDGNDNETSDDVCLHPSHDLVMSGVESLTAVSNSFHSYLQAVADLMPLLPSASSLQTIAMKCFYLNFEPSDHVFLHRCHVFSNISKILSRVDDETGDSEDVDLQPLSSSIIETSNSSTVSIDTLLDVTSQFEVKTSSRIAMIASLLDNSTETFWESGEEDRGRSKVITLSCNSCPANVEVKLIYIHMDNVRDATSCVTHLSISASGINEKGNSVDSITMKDTDIDNKFIGWILAIVPKGIIVNQIKFTLNGSKEQTVRIRQVKLLGKMIEAPTVISSRVQIDRNVSYFNQSKTNDLTNTANVIPMYQSIQQMNCESETLKVFRLLTSQVFGKLITGVDADLVTESGKAPLTTSLVSSSSSCNGLRTLLPISSSTSSHPVEHGKQPTPVNQLPPSSIGTSASSGHRSETYDSEQSTTTLTCVKSMSSSAAIASTSSASMVNSVTSTAAAAAASATGSSVCTSGTAPSTLVSPSSAGGSGVSSSIGKSAAACVNVTGDSNDLREHMVGILFSRSSKLSYLQKQILTHIVQAIAVESSRMREEWESLLCSSTSPAVSNPCLPNEIPSDSYCFEMLSMVLALSGSRIGRSYLSQQSTLLSDILSLLHTGSARVQRQVISLLRRVLPEIKPATFASILGINRMPPQDYISVIDNSRTDGTINLQQVNILDVLLACIAKSLTLQTKIKGSIASTSHSGRNITTVTLATSIHPKDSLADRWFLRGCMSRKLAEVIISLISDMCHGKLGSAWTGVTKSAIAESIINLTKLPDELRSPSECLKTPTLWLAMASLTVLNQEHAEKLSSSSWMPTSSSDPKNQQKPARPFCDNHDDNETLAIIACTDCGNLCSECDRFLHLHRKTKFHQRQIFKEEEEAIKVDLHEGCGRAKLFWLLALADSKTLKAMVEFRGASNCNMMRHRSYDSTTGTLASLSSTAAPGASETTTGTTLSSMHHVHYYQNQLLYSSSVSNTSGHATGVCRFCGSTGTTGSLALSDVCSEADCQSYAKFACNKVHQCGHTCGGIKDEVNCLPCLHGCSKQSSLKQDADDMCMICFTEALSAAPSIQLQCGHVFHFTCCKTILQMKWPGPRINFTFSLCPICKEQINHPSLEQLLQPIATLYEDVKKKALLRLEYEKLHQCDAIVKPGGRFYGDPVAFAMERYAYYVCCKCNKAYYGGEARCDADARAAARSVAASASATVAAAAASSSLDENPLDSHADPGSQLNPLQAEADDAFDPNELVCGACSDVSRAQLCPIHGTEYLEYKCRYCCSVAVFFCFGTTHFCKPCHDDFRSITHIPKENLPSCPVGPTSRQLPGTTCPLNVQHPPTGTEFALGCGYCRNTQSF